MSLPIFGSVAQLAEAVDLKSIQCGFESHRSYLGLVAQRQSIWLLTSWSWVRIPPSPYFALVAQLDRATVF